MNFVIESGIPLPTPKGKTTHGLTKAMRSMQVGQSIFVPEAAHAKMGGFLRNLRPLTFACRTEPGGMRVWRKT